MLRARFLLAVGLALALGSCSWSSGPDCPKACELAQNCTGLHATFALSCSTLAGGCFDQTADCALCITTGGTTCSDLIAGKCDSVCVVNFDGGPWPDSGPADDGGTDAGTDAGL